MRLTTYSDYALRVLMYLALKSDGLSTIAEIAGSYNVSEAHLMKVVHHLGVAGYIETVRGRGGGLRLAKPVEAIGLAEIIRMTEPDMAIVSCLKPLNAPCKINPSCVLKRAMERAQQAFMEVLEGYTLADLVAPRGRLSNLLGISPTAPTQ